MAKFFYRMQNILDIKLKLEEQAKQEYNNAQMIHRIESEKLDAICARKEAWIQDMRDMASNNLNVVELEHQNDQLYVFDEMIRNQKDVVFRAQAEMDKAREKLNEVMQERKTHEKLKEHQFENFLQELNHEEMKEIDQLVSYQHSVPSAKDDNSEGR